MPLGDPDAPPQEAAPYLPGDLVWALTTAGEYLDPSLRAEVFAAGTVTQGVAILEREGINVKNTVGSDEWEMIDTQQVWERNTIGQVTMAGPSTGRQHPQFAEVEGVTRADEEEDEGGQAQAGEILQPGDTILEIDPATGRIVERAIDFTEEGLAIAESSPLFEGDNLIGIDAAHAARMWNAYVGGDPERGGDPDIVFDEYSPFGGQSYAEALLTSRGGRNFAAALMPWGVDEILQQATGWSFGGGSNWKYWTEQYMPQAYVAGDEAFAWSGLSATAKTRVEDLMVEAGWIDEDAYVPGMMGQEQMAAMNAAMHYGNNIGVGFEVALGMAARENRAILAAQKKSSRGTGRAPFSIPAALRTIPDYESITQETQNMFRQRMGRDAEDWEMAVLADELQKQYRGANDAKITAARAAYARGGDTEVEVPNPQLRTQRFIEDRYGNEIDRYDRIEDYKATNNAIISAITKGSSMVEDL